MKHDALMARLTLIRDLTADIIDEPGLGLWARNQLVHAHNAINGIIISPFYREKPALLVAGGTGGDTGKDHLDNKET